MSKRLVLSTGLLAFGAGIAIGARWPHSTHLLGLLLEKLGFDMSDIVLAFWDPEAKERAARERPLPLPPARAKRAKARPAVAIRAPREVRPPAVVKVRRFSRRPALSAA